jgi:hypothetical protein
MNFLNLFRRKKYTPDDVHSVNTFFIVAIPKLLQAFQNGSRTAAELQSKRFYRIISEGFFTDEVKPLLREIRAAGCPFPDGSNRIYIHLHVPSSGAYGEAKEFAIVLDEKARMGAFYVMEYSPNEGYAVCSYDFDKTHSYYGMVQSEKEFVRKVCELVDL